MIPRRRPGDLDRGAEEPGAVRKERVAPGPEPTPFRELLVVTDAVAFVVAEHVHHVVPARVAGDVPFAHLDVELHARVAVRAQVFLGVPDARLTAGDGAQLFGGQAELTLRARPVGAVTQHDDRVAVLHQVRPQAVGAPAG